MQQHFIADNENKSLSNKWNPKIILWTNAKQFLNVTKTNKQNNSKQNMKNTPQTNDFLWNLVRLFLSETEQYVYTYNSPFWLTRYMLVYLPLVFLIFCTQRIVNHLLTHQGVTLLSPSAIVNKSESTTLMFSCCVIQQTLAINCHQCWV